MSIWGLRSSVNTCSWIAATSFRHAGPGPGVLNTLTCTRIFGFSRCKSYS